jgi:hypothetical protein
MVYQNLIQRFPIVIFNSQSFSLKTWIPVELFKCQKRVLERESRSKVIITELGKVPLKRQKRNHTGQIEAVATFPLHHCSAWPIALAQIQRATPVAKSTTSWQHQE